MECGNQLAPTLTITEGMPARNVRLVTLPNLAERPQLDEDYERDISC
jgi:hypothetical protein